jgi:hypothetical protein
MHASRGMSVTVLRIIARNLYDPSRKVPPDAWEARTEAGDLLVARTRKPFLDGARALLALGREPAQLVTMRIAGGRHDCFVPMPLSCAAKMAVSEPDARSVHYRRWSPGPKWLGSCAGGPETPASCRPHGVARVPTAPALAMAPLNTERAE